jgi:DNA invertase Pin-like site-specific DNA recombinase
MAAGRFVAYYRVSTDRQGCSGLGLEARRKAVADFRDGGKWELAGEYVEAESGKHDDRPELQKALAACRVYGARLVIAKLDRLRATRTSYWGSRKRGSRSSAPTCRTPTT